MEHNSGITSPARIQAQGKAKLLARMERDCRQPSETGRTSTKILARDHDIITSIHLRDILSAELSRELVVDSSRVTDRSQSHTRHHSITPHG
jgi:hypothetical protein